MEVLKINFPKIQLENDINYFNHLLGVIESIDELCSLQITRNISNYNFRIAPSIPLYINILIQEIINLHKLYNIQLDLSKSIKNTAIISFNINIFAEN